MQARSLWLPVLPQLYLGQEIVPLRSQSGRTLRLASIGFGGGSRSRSSQVYGKLGLRFVAYWVLLV